MRESLWLESPEPESNHDGSTERTDVADRIRGAGDGLRALVGEARRTWLARAEAGRPGAVGAPGGPGWRPFEDAFPTFYQFTNKPR
ncbi:MAG: hypothetical protein J2P15_12760 [Micromonosporaceae bacterium]|nr:hypothetical protein [Micromonosporaceae bacterium]